MGELPRIAAFIEAICQFGGRNESCWFLDIVRGLGRIINNNFWERKECILVVV